MHLTRYYNTVKRTHERLSPRMRPLDRKVTPSSSPGEQPLFHFAVAEPSLKQPGVFYRATSDG